MKSLPIEPRPADPAIGRRLRALRERRRITIAQLSATTGLSKGFLSRVERDITSPSVASLMALCQALDVSPGVILDAPEVTVVRWDEAPSVSLGGEGITERLITPRGRRDLQVIRAEIAPGGRGESELYTVDCLVESLHVVAGTLRLRTADAVHVDVMDGHFVPNLTLGLPVVEAIGRATDLPLDLHLMIEDPDRWAPEYAEAGAASVTFHAEAAKAPVRLARELRARGARAAMALNPGTALEPHLGMLGELDMLLLMTVGLLLSGVLGLVGKLLNGLGLGGLVNNLLGGLGLNKVLEGLGLGDLLGGGGNKKKKSGGGLLGLF